MNRQAVLEKLGPVYQAKTFGEARLALGQILGLDAAAPSAATARALNDHKYAEMLAALAHLPQWRVKLLHDPYNDKFAPPEADAGDVDAKPLQEAAALLKKFAWGVLQWGTTGFETVEPHTLHRRRKACLACDQLTDAPDTLIYKAAEKFAGGDKRMCKACGCLIAKKVVMPSERCPLPADDNPSLSRWGDPVEESAGQGRKN